MNVRLSMVLMTVALAVSSVASFSQTSQKNSDLPHGWHLLDKQKDGYNGISIAQAYEFVKSQGLKSNTVLVAVIDSGFDTLHQDLKSVIWNNPKEIPGNGVDDDHNGYVDDLHGWNFIGGKNGKNVKEDSDEGVRVYHALKAKYTSSSIDTAALQGDSLQEYKTWLKAKKKVEGEGNETGVDLTMLQRALTSAQKSDSILRIALKKDTFTGNMLDTFTAVAPQEKAAKGALGYMFRIYQMMDNTNIEFVQGFGEFVHGEERKAEAKDKVPPDYRHDIVGDNEADINDKYYGNSDVMAGTPFHGTHVSGIIGAMRDNGIGMDGVADNVKIMMVRAVPDGDEHDKDIALAIRYAVDNGARVINMSFGKDFSPEKKWVDSAVKYAEEKGVLLVHAAGNDAKNIDSADNFPNNRLIESGTEATNWITVGASGDENIGGLTASFSNYGKEQVDVFAPGVKIYSTIPGGNTYGIAQGTSMASPVVVGTAAFLLEYFPTLTPQQIKDVIIRSAQVPSAKVKKPGTDEMVSLADLCRSGGVINAYGAAKLAAELTPDVKKETKKMKKRRRAPKSTMKNIQE